MQRNHILILSGVYAAKSAGFGEMLEAGKYLGTDAIDYVKNHQALAPTVTEITKVGAEGARLGKHLGTDAINYVKNQALAPTMAEITKAGAEGGMLGKLRGVIPAGSLSVETLPDAGNRVLEYVKNPANRSKLIIGLGGLGLGVLAASRWGGRKAKKLEKRHEALKQLNQVELANLMDRIQNLAAKQASFEEVMVAIKNAPQQVSNYVTDGAQNVLDYVKVPQNRDVIANRLRWMIAGAGVSRLATLGRNMQSQLPVAGEDDHKGKGTRSVTSYLQADLMKRIQDLTNKQASFDSNTVKESLQSIVEQLKKAPGQLASVASDKVLSAAQNAAVSAGSKASEYKSLIKAALENPSLRPYVTSAIGAAVGGGGLTALELLSKRRKKRLLQALVTGAGAGGLIGGAYGALSQDPTAVYPQRSPDASAANPDNLNFVANSKPEDRASIALDLPAEAQQSIVDSIEESQPVSVEDQLTQAAGKFAQELPGTVAGGALGATAGAAAGGVADVTVGSLVDRSNTRASREVLARTKKAIRDIKRTPIPSPPVAPGQYDPKDMAAHRSKLRAYFLKSKLKQLKIPGFSGSLVEPVHPLPVFGTQDGYNKSLRQYAGSLRARDSALATASSQAMEAEKTIGAMRGSPLKRFARGGSFGGGLGGVIGLFAGSPTLRQGVLDLYNANNK